MCWSLLSPPTTCCGVMTIHCVQKPEPKTSLEQTKNKLIKALKQEARCFQNERTVQKVANLRKGTPSTSTCYNLGLASIHIDIDIYIYTHIYLDIH